MANMKMKPVTDGLFKADDNIPFKIYFKISDKKVLVLIKENTVLDQNDIDKMKFYPSENKKLFVRKEDYESFIVNKIPKNNSISHELAKSFAKHCLERDPEVSDKEYHIV